MFFPFFSQSFISKRDFRTPACFPGCGKTWPGQLPPAFGNGFRGQWRYGNLLENLQGTTLREVFLPLLENREPRVNHLAQTNPEAVGHRGNRPAKFLFLPGVLSIFRGKIGPEKHHPSSPLLKMPRHPDSPHDIDPAASPRIPLTLLPRSDPGTDKDPVRPRRQAPAVRPPGQIDMPTTKFFPGPGHRNSRRTPPFFQGRSQGARAQNHNPGLMVQGNKAPFRAACR